MEKGTTVCPVCTLYLREGITLQAHLDTHPKDKVIEALLKITVNGSSGQKVQPQSTSVGAVTASGDTLVPTQTYAAPSTAFMSQTHQNYMNPQTQMTAAVTYQQFVTSNGSVMPQYIQVPTIVCPNGNVPMVPNQTVNYVPNQQAAFANTMYNPLYNPYIPQPYPFVQPMYGNMPSTTESNTQVTTSQGTNAVTPSSSHSPLTIEPSSVLKEVSSVATNTIFPKTTTGKPKTKKGPLKTMTKTKFKFVKQSGSRVKTTTSTVATVATKSLKITSVNSKSNSTAKTAVITKAKSIKTKYRPLLPKPTTSSSVPPPPLMLMPRTQGSLECTEPPPPPPLSKAPCTSPVSFEITVKSERRNTESERPDVKPEILEGECDDIRDNKDFLLEHDEVPPVNSVIVESNSAVQITSNYLIGASITSEDEISPGFDGKRILPEVSTIENGSVREGKISESDGCEIVSVVETEQFREEQDKRIDCDVENQQLSENVFQAFDFQEEKKITFNFEVNRNIARESEIVNFSRDQDGNLIEEEYEVPHNANDQEPKNKTSETEESISTSEDEVTAISSNRKTSSYMTLWNANVLNAANNEKSVVDLSETRSVPDLKSVTYTDLQPASSSKVLQELGITTSFDMNNFMEVDGIKIFFNNASVQNMPLEPIIKFSSSVKNDVTKIASYRKPENDVRENNAMVESVIHIVSGPAPKNDVSVEAFQNSNSESPLDLSTLSPLALNIRADESMPARGELSEQESLGAENSNWGLFHSDADAMKPRQSTKEVDPLLVTVDQQEMEKKYKCPYCPEMFSCMKARRTHKINVHEKSRSSAPKKPRTFACAQCKEKFNSLRDRRRHVIQTHFFDARKVNQIKEESEAREENTDRDESIVVGLPIKLEDNVPMNEYETSVDAEGNKTFEATKMCTECGLKVTGTKKLKEHLKEVHGLSRYKCGTCSETFDTEPEYNSHLRIHPLECTQCGKMFSRKPNLRLHLRRHLVIKPYMCNQCPKSFVTRQKLDEHVNGHSGNKPLKCSLCDSTFSRYSNLIQHRNMRHLSGKKKVKDFVCRCGEVFHSLRKLEWHKEVHEPKPKTCPFCSQKFVHSNSVTRHIRRSHIPNYLPNDKKENVQCPVCGKVYLRSSLIVHMRVHNGEKPFVCKICNKSFTTKWNLALHNWTHQSRNNLPYKCNICKSAFFREVDYVAHLNSHKNHRPFTCNVCGQKFIRKYNCLRHQDEHKKEKKFVCTVNGCGKSFHRSYYLRDHMKVHTGVRPHTCHICGKASSTKSNHNKHVRIHDTREPLNTEN